LPRESAIQRNSQIFYAVGLRNNIVVDYQFEAFVELFFIMI